MASIKTRASKVRGATAEINGVRLYHEVRGNGPPLVFISGALGDAGGWDRVAELLADEFTVVTYDRRGNSRSPRPAGWVTTSIEEQADDAAGLIETLGLAPATVYGNSSGGTIALDLALRHPEAVRGAILHEPWLPWLFTDLDSALAPIKSAIERGMSSGGSASAVESFVRLVAGDAAFEALPPERRERILGNGETLLIEAPMDEDYRHDDAVLATLRRPVRILVGRETPPYLAETPHRLAETLGSRVIAVPGAHTPQLDRPQELVEAIRPFLGSMRRPVSSIQLRKEEAMNQRALLHEVKGQGEPIVLVPGGLSGWLSWIPFAERLAPGRRVIRVQLRSVELAEAGEPYPADYGTLTEREALLATVDELGLDSFDLAGWSYGGHVALAFALEHSERVRTLTLIEPEASWILRETGHAKDAIAKNEAYDRSLSGREITIDVFKDFLVRAGLGAPGDDFESLPSWPVWVRNRQVLSTIGTIHDYTDSLQRLRALEIPILTVKGTDTTEQDAAVVDDLAATAPRVRLLELPGGHASHIENMDLFLDELTRHMAVGNKGASPLPPPSSSTAPPSMAGKR